MSTCGNIGIEFDKTLLCNVNINLPAVKRRVAHLASSRPINKEYQLAWLLRAVTCIDLTTLSGDDTASNVQRLCHKASRPVQKDWLKAIQLQDLDIRCAAVCVYPNRVADCKKTLEGLSAKAIPIASVASGFPAGQTALESRLQEIAHAVEDGASEIDVVLNRALVLGAQWEGLYDEVKQMKAACKEAHMKVILATGELANLTTVYKACMVAMMAGADFVKTSTGKEVVNATMEAALVMLRAIRRYKQLTGLNVGFKPAGGIKSGKEALSWLVLMKEELGDEWTRPELFRIGASSLVTEIEKQIYHCITASHLAAHEVSMA